MRITTDDLDWARRLAREKPSTSYLQRKMLIPYSMAMLLMEILEEEGTVSARNSAGARKVQYDAHIVAFRSHERMWMEREYRHAGERLT